MPSWLRKPPRHLLVLAWAVLIAGLAGLIVSAQFASEEEPPAREAARVVVPLAPVALERSEAPVVAAIAEAPSSEAKAAETIDAAPPSAEPPAVPVSAPAPPAAPAPSPAVQPGPPAQAASRPLPAGPPISLQPSAATQSAAIAPRLPSAREAAAPAWIRFGRPFDANDRRPRIAVVVGDLGLSSAATTAAIQQLPGEVTLAFSPYADGLDQWIGLARAAGHEAVLNLPMEPINFPVNDPGPRTLLTSLSTQQNLERLDWVLTRVVGYVGVTNQMGSRFTAMPESLKPVLSALNERGLMFLDSRATPRSVAAKLASDIGLPRAIVDRQIDQEASRPAIDGRLAEIERIARETGSAVALAQPYPVTLERINAWLPGLEGKGFVLSPLTAVANRQADR